MSTNTIKLGSRQIAFSAPVKGADAGQRDTVGPKPSTERTVKVASKSHVYYPWGENNLLPNEMVKLLRSNGDAGNLLSARIDFLYGGGFGFYKHIEKDGVTIREKFTNNAIEEYLDAYWLPQMKEVVNQILTGLVETGNAFVRRSLVDGLPIYSTKDPLICRATLADPVVKSYLLCPDWSNQDAVDKDCQILPVFNRDNMTVEESIFHLRLYQTGQPYYGFAQYWGEESIYWLEVMNYIAKSMGGTVKHNKNLAHICRIASRYFDEMAANSAGDEGTDEPVDFEKQKDKVRDQFYKSVEEMFSEKNDTGPRIIYDECDLTADGKLAGFIQFEEIKRSLNASELREAYETALTAFANASRMLPGLSGVTDGKMLGGSGSELKVSANFQQFFRTGRERDLICSLFDTDVKKALKLPRDVYAGFQDILLVSDDKNPSGKETKSTSGGNAADAKPKNEKDAA